MANFHVDSSGNLWLGNTSTTFSTSAPFYVTSAGAVKASSGEIGGISIGSSSIQSTNYSATSGSEAGFKIESDGDAFFNSVDIRVDGSSGGSPSGKESVNINVPLVAPGVPELSVIAIWGADNTKSFAALL